MRDVFAVSGGVSKFTKARHDKTFQAVVKEAVVYAVEDIGIEYPKFIELVDGSVASYFSDHFQRQLMSGIWSKTILGCVQSHRIVLKVVERQVVYLFKRDGKRLPLVIWMSVLSMALKR